MTEDAKEEVLLTTIESLTNPKSSLSNTIKTEILKQLVPEDVISDSVVISIISSIGVQSNSMKKISYNLQSGLIRWLFTHCHLIENQNIFSTLYTVLFNHLSFEFIRPDLARLLFIITNKTHVKPWRTRFLLDLNSRFPSDQYITGLLLLFKQYYPNQIRDNFEPVSPMIFQYPVITDNVEDETSTTRSNELMENKRKIDEFQRVLKRRRVRNTNYRPSISPEESKLLITEVSSRKALSNSIEKIEMVDPTSILHHDIYGINVYKLLFLSISRKETTHNLHILDTSLRFNLLDENNTIDELKLLLDRATHLASYSDEILPTLYEFLGDKLDIPMETYFDLFENRVKIIPLLPLLEWTRFDSILKWLLFISVEINDERLTIFLINNLFELFKRWLRLSKRNSIDVSLTINNSLSRIIRHILDHYNDSFYLHLNYTSIFEFLGTSSDNLSQIDIKNAILPPPLVLSYFVSSNPLLISTIAGYISQVKRIKYLEREKDNENFELFKSIQNAYIMDFCNLYWRDRAFSSAVNTSNKGLLLPISLVSQISSQDDLNYNFNQSFNIFHNPAFSFLTTHIIRSIEDSDPTSEIRLAGPLVRDSFDLLKNSGQWLSAEFDDLKVDVLKNVDKMGYTGFCDLLFSCLKSLVNKR